MTKQKSYCRYGEEEAVDFLLGNMAQAEQEHYHRHLEQCSPCSGMLSTWSGLLDERQAEEVMVRQATVALAPRLYARFKRQALLHRWMNALKGLKTRYWFAAIPAFVLLIFILIGPFNTVQPEVETLITKEQFDQQMNIRLHPQSVQYSVLAQPSHLRIKGDVWINEYSQEVLVLLDGATLEQDVDYQVWLITNRYRTNIGQLQVVNRFGYLYFQGDDIAGAGQIVVSPEPKHKRTLSHSNEIIWVQLNR